MTVPVYIRIHNKLYIMYMLLYCIRYLGIFIVYTTCMIISFVLVFFKTTRRASSSAYYDPYMHTVNESN